MHTFRNNDIFLQYGAIIIENRILLLKMDPVATVVLVIFAGSIVFMCCASYIFMKFCFKRNRETNAELSKVRTYN